jgi:hypothetical protein
VPRSTRRGPVDLRAPDLSATLICELLEKEEVLLREASPRLLRRAARLALLLERERRASAINQNFEVLNADAREARRLIKRLLLVLAKIEQQKREHLKIARRHPESEGAHSAPILLDWVTEIAEARVLLRKLQHSGALRHAEFPAPGQSRLWVDIWPVVRNDVIKTVRLATGRRDVGFSQSGPLVRFLRCVIPLVTGEEPKPPTIVSWLTGKRHKTKM